jgi:EAL and modified HD-GYP domain-containing signal transduction protein
MDLMVTPKPIFNIARDVVGYRLSFQIGNAILEEVKHASAEIFVHSPFMEFVNQTGLDVLTMNKMVFLPVSDVHLMTNFEETCTVDPAKVVLLLNKKNALSLENLQRLVQFKSHGFKVAVFDYYDVRDLVTFLPHIDYLFCSHDLEQLTTVMKYVKTGRFPVKLIARHVDVGNTYDQTAALGVQYFDGQFYHVPSNSRDKRLSPLQVNYLQLLNQVNKEEFDIGQFSSVVQRDPALAIRFLKMVNSSHVRGSSIKSLRHAAALIGQIEIQRWITTAVASSLSQEAPSELTRLSLIRARFCENVAGLFDMAAHKESLFLMGLFSVLDAILDMPIKQALDMILIPDKVREALTGTSNDYSVIYEFVKMYEQGDWTELSRIALVRKISIRNIFAAYNEALLWYGRIINMQLDENELE